MADSILENIIAGAGQRLTEIRTANFYETDIGQEVLRHHLPALNYEFVPCVGYTIGGLTNTEMYTRKQANELIFRVQGVCAYSESVPPSKMAIKILSDITECVLSSEYTVNFVSGGTSEIVAGETIVGADNGGSALVASVVSQSGTWAAGNASGYMEVRRMDGVFFAGENLNMGAVSNIATVDGTPVGKADTELFGSDLIEGVSFENSEFFMPEADHKTTAVNVVFGVRFKTVAGNPYAQ